MNFKLNNNSPIYLQISKYFEVKVFLGELQPGDSIDSRRQLAGEFGVNLNTVQKAYSYMEEIGLIVNQRNKKSTITEDLNVIENLKKEYVKEPLQEFLKTMKDVKISKEKIMELVSQYYDMV